MGYYFNQLKALLKRNILLKKTSKLTLALQFILPLYCIFNIYLIGFAMKYLNKNNENESNVLAAQEPTELVSLDSYFADNVYGENPIIGFILPEGNDGSIIQSIMDNEIFKNSTIKSMQFKNQDEMTNYKMNAYTGNDLIASVVFESNDLLKYTIRLDYMNVESPEAEPIQNVAEGMAILSDSTRSQYLGLFSPIQNSIDQALIRMKTNDNTFTMKQLIGKLGKMARMTDQSQLAIGVSYGYYISLAFLISVYIITLNLVKEKEDKIKDGLLIAGVHPSVFWLSWFIIEGAITLIISLLMTVIIVVNKAYPNVNFFLLFVIIFLFSLSACSIGFIFSTFFKKSKTAGVIVLIVYMIFCYIDQVLAFVRSEVIVKVLSFFFSSVSLAQIFAKLDNLKYTYKSIGLISIFRTEAGMYLLILLFNTVLYFGIAIILDNIFSGENGRYLFASKRKVKDLHSENEVTYQKDIQEDFNAQNNEKCMVEVSRVHKLFKRKNSESEDGKKLDKKLKNTEFLAVNDVSFKVYQNEIFALLGHNGAGKTTLINIMVGLLKATYGDVYFDGSSITKNVNSIRKDFGVCAQTNIIYEELTVEDHINFYANLKNVKVDVDEVLSELDLLQQKKLKSSKLSGGQKRKLCIGMATIGNPKYIFLDEPTTGLDPLSRRKIWDLLLKKKRRKSYLLNHSLYG